MSGVVEKDVENVKDRWVGRERNKINTEIEPKIDSITREKMEDHSKDEKLQWFVYQMQLFCSCVSSGCRALEHFLGQKNRHEETQEDIYYCCRKNSGQRKIKTNWINPQKQ